MTLEGSNSAETSSPLDGGIGLHLAFVGVGVSGWIANLLPSPAYLRLSGIGALGSSRLGGDVKYANSISWPGDALYAEGQCARIGY